jgi:hypothetical protein
VSDSRDDPGAQFQFFGQTTFIDQPKDTVIANFQNAYVQESGPQREVLERLQSLVELLLQSRDLQPESKEEAVEAVHAVAGQVKEGEGSKLALRGTLNAIKDLVAGAADIAKPASDIIEIVSGAIL